MTRSCAQKSVTTQPCPGRWAPLREPTRPARTSAWAGRFATQSTVQHLKQWETTKMGLPCPATMSRITRTRVTKVTRKRSGCAKMMEQIINKMERNEGAEEGKQVT